MEALHGYKDVVEIGKNPLMALFRAVDPARKAPVRLKHIDLELLPPDFREQIDEELAVLRAIDTEYLLKILDVKRFNETGKDTILISYQYFSDTTLADIGMDMDYFSDATQDKNMLFCNVASKMAAAVAELHKTGLLHRGLNPRAFCVDRSGRRIKLDPFVWQYAWLPEYQDVSTPDMLQHILPYIAPEQTGRMKHDVDLRANLYSLGILFHEMLTGRKPLISTDPLEIIYRHMADPLPSPRSLDADIMPILSDLVMKLLEKHPDDRYQSISGLRADLQEIQEKLSRNGQVRAITLGRHDVSPILRIPSRLYGREKEIATLRNRYDRVKAGGACILLVTGRAGVGKTEMVRDLGRYVRSSGGIFIEGKYDLYQRDISHRTTNFALISLVRWLLTRPPEEMVSWQKRIRDAISPNCQILIDLMPELEVVLGKQPPIYDLPPLETRLRVNLVIDQFVSLFLRKEHPLVVFLDDLQWTDQENLDRIMGFLLLKERRYCMLIGTYREDEVNDSHPVAKVMARIQNAHVPAETIPLGPLDMEQTAVMVGETLNKDAADVMPLATVIHEKTGGNPFFLRQFMRSLHDNGAIYYYFTVGRWLYDLDQVAAAEITDNVAAILFQKIQKLPTRTLKVLQVAACIGNPVSLSLLSVLIDFNRFRIMEHIQYALNEGILRVPPLPSNNIHSPKVEDQTNHSSDHQDRGWSVPGRSGVFEFSHDRIQRAIYQTLPEDKAQAIHWKIGKAMLKKTSHQQMGEETFRIAYQFKRGMRFATDLQDKLELAELNLNAGKKAMESVSFETGLAYLRFAADLLPDNAWKDYYTLTHGIYTRLAKCEFVSGNLDRAAQLFSAILLNAASKLDKAKAYNAMIDLNTTAGNIDKALSLGREVLSLYGIRFPRKVRRLNLVLLLVRLRLVLGFRRIDFILDAEDWQVDADVDVVLETLTNLGMPAFYTDHNLYGWVVMTGNRIGLQQARLRGGVPLAYAPFAMVTLGAVLGATFDFLKLGRQCTAVGVKMLENAPYTAHRGIAYFVAAFFNRHWYEHVRKNIDFLQASYREAFNVGDTSYAGLSINAMILPRLFLGDNLDDIFKGFARHQSFIQRTGSPFVITIFRDNMQFYRCLKGLTVSRISLNDDQYDEDARYRDIVESGNHFHLFLFRLIYLKLYVLFHEWEKAFDVAEKMLPLLKLSLPTLHYTEYHFYRFLTAAALVHNSSDRAYRKSARRKMPVGLRKMRKWARRSPENFECMLLLMEAEYAKVAGKESRAMDYYRQTVRLAKIRGTHHIAAMTCELAGIYLRACGDSLAGGVYLAEAGKLYHKWGATSKTADMEKHYPDDMTMTTVFPAASPVQRFDYRSIVSALQAISTEIVVNSLLQKLMNAIMESAGANRVVFLSYKENDELVVEMERQAGRREDSNLKSEPLKYLHEPLMASVVYYVERTQKVFVIDDMENPPGFVQGVTGHHKAPESIVCLPVLRQRHLVGILYLENHMAAGVFTPDRIEILEMIASQAAISFENATLYEHLLKKEQDLQLLSENLRNLYSELLLTEERERRRIATELHDRIGHALANAKIGLEVIRNQGAGAHEKRIQDILAVIEQSITDTRTLTFELSPPILYHLGLGAAIDWLCEEIQNKHDLTVTFKDTTEDRKISHNIAVLCFQATRELIFNVVKHAHATSVKVSLAELANEYVQIIIQDDGVGFDVFRQYKEMDKNSGFGLFSINERLRLIDGTMTIDSEQGNGTTITMTVPAGAETTATGERPAALA
ncbi:MAG: AAA family ATPase [Thermodesulfobacteriota bacterium]|nr:AAA family ATPase [Thermodesulfobacteriota bacterium]